MVSRMGVFQLHLTPRLLCHYAAFFAKLIDGTEARFTRRAHDSLEMA